jgi:hypothetical protein
LVGSSRISTFTPEATRVASESRLRSPPERTDTSFSASAPENPNRPSSARALFGVSLSREMSGLVGTMDNDGNSCRKDTGVLRTRGCPRDLDAVEG